MVIDVLGILKSQYLKGDHLYYSRIQTKKKKQVYQNKNLFDFLEKYSEGSQKVTFVAFFGLVDYVRKKNVLFEIWYRTNSIIEMYKK